MIDGSTPKRIVGMVMILGMLVGSVGEATYYVDPGRGMEPMTGVRGGRGGV